MRNPVRRRDDLEDLDPALAGERTLLAWNRTALAFLAVGGSVAAVVPLAGSAILAMGGIVWLLAYTHFRMAGSRLIVGWLDRTWTFRIITAGTLVASVVALAITMLLPGRTFR